MPAVFSYAAIGLTLATVRKLSAPVLAIVAAGLRGRRRGHG